MGALKVKGKVRQHVDGGILP
jgi:hypothetical protein